MADWDEENSLVRRSRARDRAAFEQLMLRSARLMYSRLYLQTGDAHQAEDLTQETYLRAWQRIESLQDESTFRAWLGAIARSVLLDSSRRDLRRKRDAGRTESLTESVSASSADPADDAARDEQRQRVIRSLNELPPDCRDALSLRYLGGADYETIQKQLALTNGSLRGLLHRGLKLLRQKMSHE